MARPSKKAINRLKNSQLVFILPLLGVVVAYVLLIFLPNYREINKQEELIQLRQAFIEKTEALEGQISDLQAACDRTRKFCNDWKTHAPTPEQIPKIHQKINHQVSLAGATVTGFDPHEPIASQNLERIPLTIQAAGTFPEVLSMLAGLESMPETIWLEDMKLRASGEDEEEMTSQVTLVVFAKKSEDSD